MKQTLKFLLDIALSSIVPAAILNYLSQPLGAVTAYVLAALLPIGWIVVDLVVITRRFNFIASFIAVGALVRGLLTFWFVDGFWFAIKDSSDYLVTFLAFSGFMLVGRPLTYHWLIQALHPTTREQHAALQSMAAEPRVYRSLVISSGVVAGITGVAGLANILCNLMIVTAPFATADFNQQVARVNLLTRFGLTFPQMLVFAWAFWLVYRAVWAQLPRDAGRSYAPDEVWQHVAARGQQV